MNKIIFLGTAAAVTNKYRDNTSILILNKNEKILVDCPGALLIKLARLGIDYKTVSTIFITHAHPDHIYGLVAFMHSRYFLKDKINIFAHPITIELIKNIRKIFSLEDTNKFPELLYHTVKPDSKTPFYVSRNIKAYCFSVNHRPESLGLKFLFKNKKKVIFSGDTAYSKNLIKEARNCDYLIHDCFAPSRFFTKYPKLKTMHTSSKMLGMIAKEANVKTLLPIHFTCEIRYSTETVKREINATYKGKIILPNDFDTLNI